jgi:hypothetical protein
MSPPPQANPGDELVTSENPLHVNHLTPTSQTLPHETNPVLVVRRCSALP